MLGVETGKRENSTPYLVQVHDVVLTLASQSEVVKVTKDNLINRPGMHVDCRQVRTENVLRRFQRVPICQNLQPRPPGMQLCLPRDASHEVSMLVPCRLADSWPRGPN